MAERIEIKHPLYQDLVYVDDEGNEIEIDEKGGAGSGNYGHQGLAGVWGGSSPTKSVGERFPNLLEMPLMYSEPSGKLVNKCRRVEYMNHPSFGHLNASDHLSKRNMYEIGVVQAVVDKIKERTGYDVTDDIGHVMFVDSDEEMAIAQRYYMGDVLDEIEPGDIGWRDIVDQSKRAEDFSGWLGVMNEESHNVILRDFGEDNIIELLMTGSISRAEQTIAHELAHVLYYSILDREVSYPGMHGTVTGFLRANWDMMYHGRADFDRHTGYSETNAEEGFAETFVSYLFNTDPKINLEGLPKSFQVMDKIFDLVKKAKNG